MLAYASSSLPSPALSISLAMLDNAVFSSFNVSNHSVFFGFI